MLSMAWPNVTAAAKRFVSEGVYMVITGRREAELATAIEEIGN
jgi:NADP-dependent 3-hydroxy acid dehydrogenase YdfG